MNSGTPFLTSQWLQSTESSCNFRIRVPENNTSWP